MVYLKIHESEEDYEENNSLRDDFFGVAFYELHLQAS